MPRRPLLPLAAEQAPRYVPLADGARYATVCTRTLRRWIAAGDLTGYRAGPRLIRVDLNELDSLMRPIPTAAGSGGGPDVAA